MTYTPPSYSGPGGTAAWNASSPPSGWPQQSPPPDPTPRRRRRPIIACVVLTVALVAAAALWMVTLSRNSDLLANNEQLIERVGALQAEQDSLTSRNNDLRSDNDAAGRTIGSCVEALDAAEATVDVLGDVLGLAADAIDAASTFNANRLESINRDLEALDPRIERAVDDYRAAATDCRDGS